MRRGERSLGENTALRATAQIRTSASQLGFTAPPISLRLKLLEGPYHWSLFLQPRTDTKVARLVEWLEPWSPLRIEFGSRKVIRADFDPLPAEWDTRFRFVKLEMLVLHPDGDAIATVTGPHAALAALGRKLSSAAPIDVRRVIESPRDTPLLTKAQDQAVRAAIRAGYYQIPRPLNLHQIAARLDISAASLSERLRRAEGRIIRRYADEGAATPWDARTIFDPQSVIPPEEPSMDESRTNRPPVRT